MKTLRFTLLAAMLQALLAGCNGDEDISRPVITGDGITASPLNCDQYEPGMVIPVRYVLHDDVALGAYNIEIHNNFDHHSHSTSAGDCAPAPGQEPGPDAWTYSKDYAIPAGSSRYVIEQDITVPATAQPGDYHFVIRCTDQAGNQELKAVSIKVVAAR